jgi:uncharacterized protein (TIGR01777 family)
MHVLITGGTGTIGRRLIIDLLAHGHEVTVVSRQPVRPAGLPLAAKFMRWDGRTAAHWGEQLEQAEAVINLAGAGIADQRWTDERKKLLLSSRVQAGQAVVEAFAATERKPAVLIQASAVGYYGGWEDDRVFTEVSPPARDFLADICVRWEESTAGVEALGVRRVILRTGVVLDTEGGALPKIAAPFRVFGGGPVGSGRQWFPWIHRDDAVAAIRFLLETETTAGPVNLTAPNPLTNGDFARTLGRVLHRPAVAPAPAFALKLALGELAEVLLKGQRALPSPVLDWGIQFRFPQAEAALRDLLRS